MSAGSTDKGLLTPENCGVVFIDHQPQMFAAIGKLARADLLKSVQVLASAAKLFHVPVILTTVRSAAFSGCVIPQLHAMFPGHTAIIRSTMNAWDNGEFVAAVKRTGRMNFVMAALWAETCLAFPAFQMLEDGYGIYAVEDASGSASQRALTTAIRRIEQAGAVSVTALQVLVEFQRDWARAEHAAEVLSIVKEYLGASWTPSTTPSVADGAHTDEDRRRENS